jgi:hypothetical protein
LGFHIAGRSYCVIWTFHILGVPHAGFVCELFWWDIDVGLDALHRALFATRRSTVRDDGLVRVYILADQGKEKTIIDPLQALLLTR